MRFHPQSTEPDPLLTQQAWKSFTTGEDADPAVRPHIRTAWQRSRAQGCSPHLPCADVLSPSATIDLLKRESRLIEVASPFLSALSRAAGTDRHAAMLGDGQGRILKIVADPLTVEDPQFPRAGSLLSEAAAGANGIGTPLADGHYVELVGAEHYIEGFHAFTCQGVPIHDAAGPPAGVISLSVRRTEAAYRIRDILFCASEAVECELLAARLSSTLRHGATDRPMLESLRQDVVQRVATSRLQLEIAARHVAAGADASGMLQGVDQLITKFRRQAAVWRNLTDDGIGSPEPVRAGDLVRDFVELMETEARVMNVAIVPGRLDEALALVDARAYSRRLLAATLGALQAARKGSVIRMDTGVADSHAVIWVRGIDARGLPQETTVLAPLLG